MNKGSEISLVISVGAKIVAVPHIQGLSRDEAVLAMKASGLTLKTEFVTNSSVKEDYVISQSVETGVLIPANQPVTAKISLGKTCNKVGSTPSNAADQNFLTSQGDWIYFADKNDSYNLYRMRKDGSIKQLLYTGIVDNVNVVGGWVYFTSASGCESNLFKIQIDGTGLKRIDTDNVYWAYVVGDTIYTANSVGGGTIHKRDTNGRNKIAIFSASCRCINIYGDKIYYINQSDNNVYSVDTDGKNQKMIYEYNLGCDNLVVDKGILYIIAYDTLIKYDTKSGSSSFIEMGSDLKLFINVSNGWIYYEELRLGTSANPIAAYCKIRTNGTGKTTVFEKSFNNSPNRYLIVIDGWLYFTNQEDNDRIYKIYNDGTKLQPLNNN